MADDIDFTNENFEEQNMKPVAGEEANVLWARQIAGDLGHLYYNMPPILAYDQIENTSAPNGSVIIFQTFHKPSFVDTFKAYYHTQGYLTHTLELEIDGTQVFSNAFLAAPGVDSGNHTKAIGQTGQDEWLVATVTMHSTADGAWRASIEIYPDWASI